MPTGNDPHPREPANIELSSAKYLPPGVNDDLSVAQGRIRELETAPTELGHRLIGGAIGLVLLALSFFVVDLYGLDHPPDGPMLAVVIVRGLVALGMFLTGVYLVYRCLPRLYKLLISFI